MNPSGAPPGPFMPAFAQLMPIARLNAMIQGVGVKLGWMKGHACPCTGVGDAPGSPQPGCLTCFGRGTYWDSPPVPFVGLITYMHTSAAPDEPGSSLDSIVGMTDRAEPTLSIPSTATAVWAQAGEMDAYVETDATTRRQSVLVVGGPTALPYPANAVITGVNTYDQTTSQVAPVPALGTGSVGYTFSGGCVTLTGYAPGDSYSVEYISSPVYVAYRASGGLVHRRPFGQGQALPIRFHLQDMDMWTRQRFSGDGPQGLPGV